MNNESKMIALPENCNKLYLALGWEYIEDTPVDLNMFSVAVDSSLRMVSRDALCYHQNDYTLEGALRISPDNKTGLSPRGREVDEYMIIDCNQLPPSTSRVYFGVQIFDAKVRLQSFQNLTEAFLLIKDLKTSQLLINIDLDENINESIGAIVGYLELYTTEPYLQLQTEPLFGQTIPDSIKQYGIGKMKKKFLFF